MFNWLGNFSDFFHQGGPVLLAILFASILLWSLIFERYWFYLFRHHKKMDGMINSWKQIDNKTTWYAMKTREGYLADISMEANHNLKLIDALIGVLPLLGLLGTVTGMITIFEVMNIFGNENARAMAGGISRALLPTTAGLVASLSAIYFSTDLKRRANHQLDLLRDSLNT